MGKKDFVPFGKKPLQNEEVNVSIDLVIFYSLFFLIIFSRLRLSVQQVCVNTRSWEKTEKNQCAVGKAKTHHYTKIINNLWEFVWI